jgi:hypothetical protein
LLLGQQIVLEGEQQTITGEIHYFNTGVLVLKQPSDDGFRFVMVNLEAFQKYSIVGGKNGMQVREGLVPVPIDLGQLLSE